mmetsp:Transcript_39153/g.116458  ORF Transcript_39153/g.116458 Transcript_39153/m.116458 type:complete len:183 (-) Transcript_39153:119-667(-)
MGCCGRFIVAIISIILECIKVGVAVAIIVITALHLADYNIVNDVLVSTCVLADTGDDSICNYAYAVGGLSLALSLALSILLCFTCNLCGLGPILECCFNGVGAVWWLIAALIFSAYVSEANKRDPPFAPDVENWRTSIPILAWIGFAAFTLMFMIYIGKIIAKCCECCSCCDDDDDKGIAKV